MASSAPSPAPSGWSGLLWLCWGLAAMWAAHRREVNYSGHNGPGLLYGRPPPLMGKVRPPHLLFLPCSRLLPPPFASSCVGGGASQVLGVSPHLLYQAAHEGRARLLRGCPLPLRQAGGFSPPTPPIPACCVLGSHTAWGVPPPRWPVLDPPSLSCMKCAGIVCCLGVPLVASLGSPPPLPCMPCAGSAR